ncbi:MAG: nucleotidyltransferase family protein [Candidatus Omnitrophica bacterium]|nr:nucleotidyltransferase family protein [Candidatus Omnitrophota bacterium]
MELYSPETKLLLDVLCGRAFSKSDKINYARLVKLAENHDLAALIFYRLQGCGLQLPEINYSLLKSRYIKNIRANLRLWNEFLQINSEFEKNNIDMAPIKGIDILARFYPELDLRSMVDIDILVREEQLQRVQNALCALGYHKELFNLKEDYWRKQQCHIVFHNKNRITVEAHWALDFKRDNRVILPKLWKRMNKKEISGHKINLLSPEDAIFSLALHLRRYGTILSLKQVFDAARIIKESAGFDWGYMLQESKNGKIQATLYFILIQITLFTQTNIPADVLREPGLALWQKMLIKRFIKRHTFQIPVTPKKNYLAAHFLLYDNLCEPVYYLINIPYEQFCKFYNLKPYTRKADILYRLRIPYMAASLLKSQDT